MYSDCHGKDNEKASEKPMVSNTDGTIKQSKPQSCYSNNLHPQRNSLMYHEIGYIWSKTRMIHQPVI